MDDPQDDEESILDSILNESDDSGAEEVTMGSAIEDIPPLSTKDDVPPSSLNPPVRAAVSQLDVMDKAPPQDAVSAPGHSSEQRPSEGDSGSGEEFDPDDLSTEGSSPRSPGAANDELLQTILDEEDEDDDLLMEDDPSLVNQIIEEQSPSQGKIATAASPATAFEPISRSQDGVQGKRVEALVKGMSASAEDHHLRQPLEASKRQDDTTANLFRVQTFAFLSTEYGGPTAMVVRSKFIAIGTANGTCLVYDHFQTLRTSLQSTVKGGPGPVPVTSLDVSESVEWLCAAHLDGRLVLWDWQNGQVLLMVDGKHSSGIVHCLFIDMPEGSKEQVVLTADQDGLVNKTVFSKGWLWKITSSTQVLVNGVKSGRVLALSSLRRGVASHPILELGLVAMSTEDRDRVTALGAHTCIARILPEPQIVRQAPCPQGVLEGTVPYLTWLPPVTGEHGASDPCLAIAWGHTLQIVTVSLPNGPSSTPVFSQLAIYTTSWNFCGIQFLTSESMVAQSADKQLYMLELKATDRPDTKRVADLKPMPTPMPVVYHSYYVNVYGEPQPSFHNSFWASGHLLYLLSFDQVGTAKVLPWQDRLQTLVDQVSLAAGSVDLTLIPTQAEWHQALLLAMEFYRGTALAVVGLPRKLSLRKSTVKDKAKPIILGYVGRMLPPLLSRVKDEPKSAKVTSELQDIAAVAIEFCVTLDAPEILYGTEIYGQFEAANQCAVFFEVLEPYILRHAVNTLPAAVLQALVDEYKAMNRLRRVELCLLHLEVNPAKEVLVDLDQLMKLCVKHSLFLALIHVCNNGLADYVRPLETISACIDVVNSGGDSGIDSKYCGQIMLVYLGYIFAGQAIPSGNLDAQIASQARNAVLDYLFLQQARVFLQLLSLDAPKTMAVLESGLCVESPTHAEAAAVQQRVHIVADLLIDFSADAVKNGRRAQTEAEVLALMMMGNLVAHDKVTLSYHLTNRVLLHLVTSHESADSVSAQAKLCHVLAKVHCNAVNSGELFPALHKAQWWEACAMVHQKEGEYAKVVQCMLHEPEKTDVFKYMRGLLGFDREKPELQNSFKHILLEHLIALMSVNSELTADFVLTYYVEERLEFMYSLSSSPEKQYAYLSALITRRAMLEMRGAEVLTETHQKYLTLLCEYAPDQVLPYLRNNPNDYPLELALALVQRHHLLEAEAYVQERTGNVQVALEFHLKALDTKMQHLLSLGKETLSPRKKEKLKLLEGKQGTLHEAQPNCAAIAQLLPRLPQTDEICTALDGALDLCVRKGNEEPEHCDTLWFAVLDKVAEYIQVAAKANCPLEDNLEGWGTINYLLEIVRLLFRLVVGRMVDSGEHDLGVSKSLGEKLKRVFDKLLCDYGSAAVSEIRGCVSDLLSRAAFHVQTCTSAVKLEDQVVFESHWEYLSSFKFGKRFDVKDSSDLAKPQEELNEELRAKLHKQEEIAVQRGCRKARFMSSVLARVSASAATQKTKDPIDNIGSLRKYAGAPVQPKLSFRPPEAPEMDEEPLYFNEAAIFED